jgi:hypothetical protein
VLFFNVAKTNKRKLQKKQYCAKKIRPDGKKTDGKAVDKQQQNNR